MNRFQKDLKLWIKLVYFLNHEHLKCNCDFLEKFKEDYAIEELLQFSIDCCKKLSLLFFLSLYIHQLNDAIQTKKAAQTLKQH